MMYAMLLGMPTTLCLCDGRHMILDVVGMVPGLGEVADLANAGLYAYEGDYGNAALSMASAVPGYGDMIGGAKIAKNVVKTADKIGDAARASGKVADKATDIGPSVKKCTNGTSCFTAGTQIVVGLGLTEAGEILNDTKNIEDIAVGDLVYSYDTATGEYGYNEVTAFFERETKSLIHLTIIDSRGNEQTIETTEGHPFWVVTENPDLTRAARSVVDEDGVWLYHEDIGYTETGYWVEAKDLRPGDVFLGANGELSTLQSTLCVQPTGGIAVFNFEVAGNHNYFVLAKEFELGQTCVLVHNATIVCLNGEKYLFMPF